MYVDRFIDLSPVGNILSCKSCYLEIGHLINYKKENREAYRLFAGAINKKTVSLKNLPQKF